MASQSRPSVVSFSGEVDDYTLARIDLDIHPTTAERMENVYTVEQGAMELPPGTQFLRATPGNGLSVLRGWVSGISDAFCVEFSDELLRLIEGDGYVTLTGAAATVGTFSDESAVTPSGGDPAPEGGGGEGVSMYPPADGCTWVELPGGGFWVCPPEGAATP